MIAGSGDSLELLKKEFPLLQHFTLPGYDPKYPTYGPMIWAMVRQLPRFIQIIASEHLAVERIVRMNKVDVIIADNRYGCWSAQVPSVFITHQSNVLMPQRFGFLGGFVRRISERLINRFHLCWIPDFPEGHSLAGDMIASGTPSTKAKMRYIGWLSRFQRSEDQPLQRYEVLAVLSGPEPQRSMLERIVVPQLRASGMKYMVVRGLPGANEATGPDMVSFLTSRELQEYIESSEIILARSGYSTIMDMNALGKKAIFVPTPGQTEQEYLANQLMKRGVAYSVAQKEFNLRTALSESVKYTGFAASEKTSLLAEAIDELIREA
jgi:uncharacterized protein (TIGR00661 family)